MNNNENVINSPYKIIVNSINIGDIQGVSFINCVLQVFAILDCIKLWCNNLNSNQIQIKFNSIFTKEILKLLNSLYNNQQPDSTNIILQYNNYIKTYCKKQIKQDPFEFMSFLLDKLHEENNSPLPTNLNQSIINNQSLQNRRNLATLYNLYIDYFQKSFNSIISHNFTNILKYEMMCQNCSNYFNFNYKNILEFDIDEYRKNRDKAFPQKTCMNLNMDECFANFIGGYENQCIYCYNNGFVYTKIFNKNKVLIIAFKRKNHGYHCDIDFENKLNISKYCSNKNKSEINSNTIYILRGCISLNNNGQFFSDICINNKWFRFINNQINLICNNDIHIFEPQLLIYELENQNNQYSQNNQFNQNNQNNQMIRANINGRPSIMKLNMNQQNMIRQNIMLQNMNQQNMIRQNMIQQNMIQQNMIRQNIIQQNMIRQNIIQQNMIRQNIMRHQMMQPLMIQQKMMQNNMIQINMINQKNLMKNKDEIKKMLDQIK